MIRIEFAITLKLPKKLTHFCVKYGEKPDNIFEIKWLIKNTKQVVTCLHLQVSFSRHVSTYKIKLDWFFTCWYNEKNLAHTWSLKFAKDDIFFPLLLTSTKWSLQLKKQPCRPHPGFLVLSFHQTIIRRKFQPSTNLSTNNCTPSQSRL